MAATHLLRGVRRAVRAPSSLVVVLALVLAACAGASVSPTIPPDATSSLGPPATATPPAGTPVAPTVAPAVFPVTVTDDEGTAVTIAAEPRRIVSLTPATTEILFAIGAGPRVAAKVEDVADYPPAAHDLPVVATFSGVDVEKIVALGADLVVSGGAGLSQGPAVEKLRKAGIPVVVSYPTRLAGAVASIRTIGRAAGRPVDADALAGWMEARFAELSAAVEDRAKPRVYYEIDATNGLFTPPADSIYGEMLRLAGSDPIAGDASYTIPLEKLVSADPEVILLGDAAYGVTADQVAKRPGWDGMTAVKAGRIVDIDDVLVTRPGPRLVDGLRALIAAIHPEVSLPAIVAPPSPGPPSPAATP